MAPSFSRPSPAGERRAQVGAAQTEEQRAPVRAGLHTRCHANFPTPALLPRTTLHSGGAAPSKAGGAGGLLPSTRRLLPLLHHAECGCEPPAPRGSTSPAGAVHEYSALQTDGAGSRECQRASRETRGRRRAAAGHERAGGAAQEGLRGVPAGRSMVPACRAGAEHGTGRAGGGCRSTSAQPSLAWGCRYAAWSATVAGLSVSSAGEREQGPGALGGSVVCARRGLHLRAARSGAKSRLARLGRSTACRPPARGPPTRPQTPTRLPHLLRLDQSEFGGSACDQSVLGGGGGPACAPTGRPSTLQHGVVLPFPRRRSRFCAALWTLHDPAVRPKDAVKAAAGAAPGASQTRVKPKPVARLSLPTAQPSVEERGARQPGPGAPRRDPVPGTAVAALPHRPFAGRMPGGRRSPPPPTSNLGDVIPPPERDGDHMAAHFLCRKHPGHL